MPPKKQVKHHTSEPSVSQREKMYIQTENVLNLNKIPKRLHLRIAHLKKEAQLNIMKLRLWKVLNLRLNTISKRLPTTRPGPVLGVLRNIFLPKSVWLSCTKYAQRLVIGEFFENARFFNRLQPLRLKAINFQSLSFFYRKKKWRKKFISRAIPKLAFQATSLRLSELLNRQTNLQELSMNCNPSSEFRIKPIKFRNIQNLKKLNCCSSSKILPFGQIQKLQMLEQLTIYLYAHECENFPPNRIISGMGKLSHLKRATININFDVFQFFKTPLDLSPLQGCDFLESLNLVIYGNRTYSLDFLKHLKFFRELILEESQYSEKTQEEKKTFPYLSNLETWQLINVQSFSSESIRSVISENSNLKVLSLKFPFHLLAEILSENLVCSVEIFSVDVAERTGLPDSKQIFLDFLRNNSHLKSFSLIIDKLFADVDSFFEPVKGMNQLENLHFSFLNIGDGVDFKIFYEALSAIASTLKSLVLEINRKKTAFTELFSLLKELMNMKNLQKLHFWAFFEQDPDIFDLFLQFLSSVRHVKDLKVRIGGISVERCLMIEEILQTKSCVYPLLD